MTINIVTNIAPNIISSSDRVSSTAHSTNAATQVIAKTAQQVSEPKYTPVELEQFYANVEPQSKQSFQVDYSIFTIFKMPDGKIYCRERDLNSNQVSYYPTIESSSYQRPVEAIKGTIIKKEV
ncbi:MAG: hypothetical protein J0H68_07685 [Sphingobacteriia bacterium]|nr:hypothetical protein [Sphingobacteriia bacterium]